MRTEPTMWSDAPVSARPRKAAAARSKPLWGWTNPMHRNTCPSAGSPSDRRAVARSTEVRATKSAPWSTSTTREAGTLNSPVTMVRSSGLWTSTREAARNTARVANAEGSLAATQRRSTSWRRSTTLGPDRKAAARARPVEMRDDGVAGWS